MIPQRQAAQAYGINSAGQVVGNYVDGTGTHGFLFSGSAYTTIDDPFAAPGQTFAHGINDSGEIVGYYYDAHGLAHGFFDNGGTFTNIDDSLGTKGTFAEGVNNLGEVVGYYVDSSGATHGFLANPITASPDTGFVSKGGTLTDSASTGVLANDSNGVGTRCKSLLYTASPQRSGSQSKEATALSR